MSVPAYRRSRFDAGDDDPMGPLANLADIMLVFAVGLMVALAASSDGLEQASEGGVDVDAGRELPDVPDGAGEAGSGYESVGQVYRDPETGRLIMIGGED
ncbi:DUF2149 domain-containing protein [Aquisalimonas asiatica]|uniref:DUF2149 domain-containing protein n=1 Tax=Aquisalimonas asiatica TaxID=406100 RepID=A0A1H8UEI8_9GAMM|nr:DUF2149 domain-containing protein [Aquisalimonas asiatica]SEP01629.1 hypothetical protein SAMN04488052_106147 [Aquisalimonas asiatica]